MELKVFENVRLEFSDGYGRTPSFNLFYDAKSDGTVPVTLQTTADYYKIYWLMRLQRKNLSTGAWENIGTRAGYVSYQSPSNRTFTSVKESHAPLRVEIEFYEDSDFTYYLGATIHSNNFYMYWA